MTPEFVIKVAKRMAKNRETKIRLREIGENIYPAGFCEPGYDKGKTVILGNWNATDRYDALTHRRIRLSDGELVPRLQGILEKMGCLIEWIDACTRCDDCSRVFRTEPDSYDWQAFGWSDLDKAETKCGDCWANDDSEDGDQAHDDMHQAG